MLWRAADNNAIPDCAFDYLSGLCENRTAPALANGSFPVVACCELCIEHKLEGYGEALHARGLCGTLCPV